MLIVGVLLTVGSIFADQLHLTGGGVGLGWKQLIGAIVGLVLALLGGAWLIQPPTSRLETPPANSIASATPRAAASFFISAIMPGVSSAPTSSIRRST